MARITRKIQHKHKHTYIQHYIHYMNYNMENRSGLLRTNFGQNYINSKMNKKIAANVS